MRHVVFRSNMSGVWFGRLVKSADARVRVLRDARRAYEWEGALTCSELASKGPGAGSRICGVVRRVQIQRADGDELLDVTPEAVKAWTASPVAK